MYIFWSLLGGQKSLGHAQIGLLQGFNSKFPTSVPTPFICGIHPLGPKVTNCSCKWFTRRLVRGQTGSIMLQFVLVPRVICNNRRARKNRSNWNWSGKSPYFTLSFSFQINISVKITVWGCCDTFVCGNLDEKFVSDQSSGLKEMFRRWMRWVQTKFPALLCSSCAAGHFPATAARVSRP